MNNRQQFEAWEKKRYGHFNHTHPYEDPCISEGFEGWKAGAESKQTELDKANVQIEQLLTQLPEGMKHCTIVFKECELGHGRLTATNWVQHECPACNLDKANARIAQLEEALKAISTFPRYEMPADMAKKALSGFSDTWLSQHDKAVEVKVLEEIVATTQNITLIPHAAFGQLYGVIEHMIESRK